MKFEHLCEVCGKKELLSSEESFNQGWDYPPNIGQWGVISPRTCGDCGIEDTAWWALVQNPESIANLSDKHRKTVERIAEEGTTIRLV